MEDTNALGGKANATVAAAPAADGLATTAPAADALGTTAPAADGLATTAPAADALAAKYEKLKECLCSSGSVAVAYSSGVDSTLLLWAAHEALGEQAVAIRATSNIFPPYERDEAEVFCKKHGIRQIEVPVDPFALEGFHANPADRCYSCKKLLFTSLIKVASHEGFAAVCDGTNADDTGEYRPGLRALSELNVVSPLLKAGLTKREIRELSRRIGLPTAEKPSFACLMTRFEYGQNVTNRLLYMVGQAELCLLDEGFRQIRVRYHSGDIARIEMAPSEMHRMFEEDRACRIEERLKDLGFSFVTLDLGGYTTGKMNASVEQKLLQEFK